MLKFFNLFFNSMIFLSYFVIAFIFYIINVNVLWRQKAGFSDPNCLLSSYLYSSRNTQ